MERLTKYKDNYVLYVSDKAMFLAVRRLAQYEDTGLTPEEIEKMKKELSEYRRKP